MEKKQKFILIIALSSSIFLIILIFTIYLCRRRHRPSRDAEFGVEFKDGNEIDTDDLIKFDGSEDLTVRDILDAPGEVIGKSSYGTVYRASLQRANAIALLRFLRPACTATAEEMAATVMLLGAIRHPNLVPLLAFYAGPRGEKLMVHPYYRHGHLASFIREKHEESHKWDNIYRISIGIAKGLDFLHKGLQKPIIHGNLKSKNVLLDRNRRPYLSDFGIHLLLNPTANQELLESSSAHGYKAPELMKMKDANLETDIYSFGVILFELITGEEPILDHRINDVYDPTDLLDRIDDRDRAVKIFGLAMDCCYLSPSLRPDSKQIIQRLEEIGE